MGAITGNGYAISSTGKLRVWVLTNTPRGHYVVSTIGQKGCFVPEDVKKCIQWDSNPRQRRIRPERTALDHSAMNAREAMKFLDVLLTRYSIPTLNIGPESFLLKMSGSLFVPGRALTALTTTDRDPNRISRLSSR